MARHHYLPRFYLEGFARDGFFYVFDRVTREYRVARTNDTAVISGYYAFEDESGESSEKVEEMLSKIEGAAKPIIEKLDRRERISATEKEELALFASFQYVRVPQYQRTVEELSEGLFKRLNQAVFATPELAAETMRRTQQRRGEEPPSDVTPEEMVDFAGRGDYAVSVDRVLSLKLMVEMAPRTANLLRQMNWFVLHAPDRKSFVTTDAPFTLYPPVDYDPTTLLGRGVGIITPGAFKTLPVTQRTALAMGDRGNALVHTDVSDSAVRSQNLMVAAGCDRLVIGRDEALVRSIVQKTGIDRTEPRRLVHMS